jgi:sugar phosphate isomerase/epimerase
MVNYENFYTGSEYPFEKPYAGFTSMGAYHPEVKNMAYPTDPLTANQLKKVSDKISTGAQTIEVSGLGLTGAGPMKHLASIPRQHWKEIDRLRKLTGVDLTFHGPLVESTGYSRGNWSEDQRKEAETQMKAAVELAQQMNSDDKKKGVVMTFHSNNGLPEVERKVVVGRTAEGKPIEEVVQMSVVNTRTGQIGSLPTPKYDYFGNKKETATEALKEFNERQWQQQIESVFINNNRARRELVETLTSTKKMSDEIKVSTPQYENGIFDAFKEYNQNYDKYKQDIMKIKEINPSVAAVIQSGVTNLKDAGFFIKESYNQLKELYNEAYEKAKENPSKKEVVKQLEKYRDELAPVFQKFEKEGTNLLEFQDKINDGTRLLQDKKVTPEIFTPLRQWAVDKSSDTFSEVAMHAYKNAKKYDRAPGIISIENPPAGMSGLTRAEEIADLVRASREKFVKKAVKDGMSEFEAKNVSEQIIGATWDVGHINSIQKWGYNRKDVIEQAKKIGPYVKHMHIADNLGFEDAELPIGMGNVPIDEILASNENFRKAKKAIETGDWFSRQGGLGMSYTPVRESLSGLTAPVYSMGAPGQSAYWNQAVNNYGNYFGGLGDINPQVHHSIYGAGFGQLPAYLGGEIPGKQNSSFSGSPLE